MFGLTSDEWRDLVLSVNVRRKNRRLSPSEAAKLLSQALQHTDISSLAEALGFEDTTTLRRIARLADLPPDLASTVEWGTRRGGISMSTASELLRLETEELIREAVTAAIEQDFSRDEARQLVQIRERSQAPFSDCINQVLLTRPRIERSDLILGSLLTEKARAVSVKLGNDAAARRLGLLMARKFPDVIPKALRINGDRFSILLSDVNAASLRKSLTGKSVETVITEMVESIQID